MGEPLGLSYSQYCSLNTSHGTDGGEIILQSKSFSVGHYPLHSREINLWKTVIIYCLQGGVGWGGGLEDLGCVTIKIQLISP